MNTIPFFTPITYGNKSCSFGEKLLEHIDDYFFIKGKKAEVIRGFKKDNKEAVALIEFENSFSFKTILKVSLCATVVFPLIALAAKAILRIVYQFYLIAPTPDSLQPPASGLDSPPPSGSPPAPTTLQSPENEEQILDNAINPLPFNIPTTLSPGQAAPHKIQLITRLFSNANGQTISVQDKGFSDLPVYHDSFFYVEFQSNPKGRGTYSVIRKHLKDEHKENSIPLNALSSITNEEMVKLKLPVVSHRAASKKELDHLRKSCPYLKLTGSWFSNSSSRKEYAGFGFIWQSIQDKNNDHQYRYRIFIYPLHLNLLEGENSDLDFKPVDLDMEYDMEYSDLSEEPFGLNAKSSHLCDY